MESSRRAVEAYRRTRLIDGVTTDDDKVAPVYKLDEIGALLQASPQAVVHELVEYIFRKLDHKSPIVKQKTLRLIKFVAGKAGSDFKREVQRQSAAIRQLFHYRGQPDPLRGDSLNKAVRDTAHEAIAALFAEEKSPAFDEVSRRIQGFGSTNFDGRAPPPPSQEKKTLLSEVVDLGASSIKQGISILSNHYNQYNTNGVKSSASNGSYEAPNFRRSLGNRDTYSDKYRDSYSGSRGSYSEPRISSEPQSYAEPEASNDEEEPSSEVEDMTFEDKLLSSLTPVGGVRLHPNRESIQSFLLEGQRSNPERLFLAFEQRLQLHSWQVRLKALCFLEAALRQKDIKAFGELSTKFQENPSSVMECTESPQNSLREKAKKVLQMLSNAQPSSSMPTAPQEKTVQADLPDLMDTSDVAPKVEASGLDLLAELSLGSDHSSTAPVTADASSEDPFAGMSIHASSKPSKSSNGDSSSLFEGLSVSQDEQPVQPQDGVSLIADLLSDLSTGDKDTQESSSSSFLTATPLDSKPKASPTGIPAPAAQLPPLSFLHQQQQLMQLQFQQQQQQMLYMNSLLQPGMVQQQAFGAAQGFPGLIGAPFGQQQQQQQQQGFAQGNFGLTGTGLDGFDFAGNPYASTAGVPARKEETKAFDFIADHVAAARTVRK